MHISEKEFTKLKLKKAQIKKRFKFLEMRASKTNGNLEISLW
jgi:hypothetical protein